MTTNYTNGSIELINTLLGFKNHLEVTVIDHRDWEGFENTLPMYHVRLDDWNIYYTSYENELKAFLSGFKQCLREVKLD